MRGISYPKFFLTNQDGRGYIRVQSCHLQPFEALLDMTNKENGSKEVGVLEDQMIACFLNLEELEKIFLN